MLVVDIKMVEVTSYHWVIPGDVFYWGWDLKFRRLLVKSDGRQIVVHERKFLRRLQIQLAVQIFVNDLSLYNRCFGIIRRIGEVGRGEAESLTDKLSSNPTNVIREDIGEGADLWAW